MKYLIAVFALLAGSFAVADPPKARPTFEYAQLIRYAQVESWTWATPDGRIHGKSAADMIEKITKAKPRGEDVDQLDLFNAIGAEGWEYVESEFVRDLLPHKAMTFKRAK